ncbi:hypothetical protein J3R30DRAFT_2882816 [Lentinula aciculospora]|uniref:Uncharacterized protein n=1 Tax=Lentinula aciculospora TaxID=153920 RepID=A0A9W9DNN9_9AGAR|nr:hypothetical protein J3R30DRAFT_2882816 [Lentinula aciculospora]
MSSSSHSVNPGIARTMTGLLERTRTRRTFSKDSFTSPAATNTSSPPAKSKTAKVDDLLAEQSRLQTELEKAVHDGKVAEKGKAEAERQSQDSLQLLAKERQVSEDVKAERDDALKEVDSSRSALHAAEERAEKAEEESRAVREQLEEELAEARRLAEEMKEKLAQAEKDLAEAEQAKRSAIIEVEAKRQALEQALQLTDRYRTAAEQMAKEKSESEQVSRQSLEQAKQEVESSRAALGEVERRISDEREAREKAERELRRRNEEIPAPHTLFGYAMSTFKSRETASGNSHRGSSSWVSGCVIA